MPGSPHRLPESTHRHDSLPAARLERALRPLWRQLRRRDARPRARRTEGVLRGSEARSGVRRRVPLRARALRRPAEPDLPRGAPVARARRRADPPEARGPQPHRRAQDQQHDRPGDARAPHGQAACHRRDRRRPARRRDGDDLRPLRPRVHRLHGQRGRQAAGAERLPHEPARRQRRAGRKRLEDAEGRAQRGVARLGDERREHVLHHRHGRRPASVSDDGARLPERDRRRVPACRCPR